MTRRDLVLPLVVGLLWVGFLAWLIYYAAPTIDFTEADLRADPEMCIKSPLPGCVLSPYPGAMAKR